MTCDPDRHHRRSIRLRMYDYGQAGAYFVTICVQGGENLLGKIVGNEMRVTDAGGMVARWWLRLQEKFPGLETDESIIMPNHFHGIIVIADPVGSAPPGRPDTDDATKPALGDIVGWFKTMTTNEYIRGVKTLEWPPFQGRFWQRNYYEHIIRNDDELNRIRAYIEANPAQWAYDRENPDAIRHP